MHPIASIGILCVPLPEDAISLGADADRPAVAGKVASLEELDELVIAVTADAARRADARSLAALGALARQARVHGLAERAEVVRAFVDVEAEDLARVSLELVLPLQEVAEADCAIFKVGEIHDRRRRGIRGVLIPNWCSTSPREMTLVDLANLVRRWSPVQKLLEARTARNELLSGFC
jgi:hypothetical protein